MQMNDIDSNPKIYELNQLTTRMKVRMPTKKDVGVKHASSTSKLILCREIKSPKDEAKT